MAEAEAEAEAIVMRLRRLPSSYEKDCEECQGNGTWNLASECSGCRGTGRVTGKIPKTSKNYADAEQAEARAKDMLALFRRTPEEEADACRAAMEAGERFAAAERRAEGERRRAEANLWRSPNFHFGVRVELPTLSFPPTEESCSRTVADVLTEVKP